MQDLSSHVRASVLSMQVDNLRAHVGEDDNSRKYLGGNVVVGSKAALWRSTMVLGLLRGAVRPG